MNIKEAFSRRDLVPALVIAGIGLVAGVALVSMQWPQLDESMREEILAQLGSREAVVAMSSVQIALLSFIAAFAGIKLARRVQLQTRWIPAKDSWMLIMGIAFAVAAVIGLGDRFVFSPLMNMPGEPYAFSLLYFVSSLLYGGIIEEVFLRLFVMSLIVALVRRLPGGSVKEATRSWVYWVAVVLAALLFAAGHLPATAQLFGLNVVSVTRALLLNAVGGLGFGYLYWRNGIGAAMAAHIATHVFLQLIVLPLVA